LPVVGVGGNGYAAAVIKRFPVEGKPESPPGKIPGSGIVAHFLLMFAV
jgi:hypothetical protein